MLKPALYDSRYCGICRSYDFAQWHVERLRVRDFKSFFSQEQKKLKRGLFSVSVVEFATRDEAQKAIRDLNDQVLLGRSVFIREVGDIKGCTLVEQRLMLGKRRIGRTRLGSVRQLWEVDLVSKSAATSLRWNGAATGVDPLPLGLDPLPALLAVVLLEAATEAATTTPRSSSTLAA
jgi:hypothetical protein